MGSDTINPTWKVGIGGTDLGHMINLGEKTFVIFGDTFESDRPKEKNDDNRWRWNTMAWTTDADPRDGLTFDGWIGDSAGHARAVIEDRRAAPITNIPTGGIAAGGRLYLWYMAMKFWGSVEDPCWRAHYSGLAWSDDEGHTFHIAEDFRFAEGSNFGMVAAVHGSDDPALTARGDGADGYVYVWGTPANRCGGVALARVREEEIADQTKWEYCAGNHGSYENDGSTETATMVQGPHWSSREADAAVIVSPPAGELSVMYNRWAGSWIMLYITFQPGENPMLHPGRIVLRQAPAPWGPWGEPVLVADDSRFPGGLYGSYMNPRYVEDDGRVIYFTMSLWHPYDVYWLRAELAAE